MMRVFATAAAAAAMMVGGAVGANAQPAYGYGYGELPPAPYAETGAPEYNGGGACGADHFTLVGARAGVTVLGFDLGAGAHFSAPVDSGCGGGEGVAYAARPYAPPPPPPEPAYGDQGYGYGGGYGGGYGYAPPPPPAPAYGYAPPCGCEGPPRW